MKITAIVAVLTALVGALAYFEALPVTQAQFSVAQALQDTRITANEEYRYLERYKYLIAKRTAGGLTFEEQKELCLLAQILNFKVDGCV